MPTASGDVKHLSIIFIGINVLFGICCLTFMPNASGICCLTLFESVTCRKMTTHQG